MHVYYQATAAAQVSVSSNGSAEGTAFLTASNTGIIKIYAVVSSGAGSPTISIQGLKVTSGTLTVKLGSVMRYRVLGT